MVYNIAGMKIDINFKYDYGKKKCEKYLSNSQNETPDFSVFATNNEINQELPLVPQSTVESAEFDCIFRKIYNTAPKFDRIPMHGAAIMKDGKGFIFAAPSGTGKSTHIRLWGKRFGSDVTVIDGDKPFVGFENNVATVWGSPRSGKEGWNNPISAPLKAIAFLERGDKNKITPISPTEIFDKAFMQFYFPKNRETAELTAKIINNLLCSVPLYKLQCNMDIEAAEIAFLGMDK